MIKLSTATHNICHCGFDPITHNEMLPDKTHRFGYDPDKVNMMKEYWHQVYSSFSADVIGFQEFCPWLDSEKKLNTASELFEPFGYKVDEGAWESKMRLSIASRLPMERVYEMNFEPVSLRRRRKNYLTVDGRRIAIFNCHLTAGQDYDEVRRGEREILLEEFKKEDCFIAFGDYNSRTGDEFEIFADAGFNMANDTGFGTVRKTGHSCDNIIVSPNIRIEKTELFDRDYLLSDHNVLYAELVIE